MSMERTANHRQANSLCDRVAWVKSEASCGHGRPPAESFRRIIENKDKTRCIGAIAFEDLWTGADGWKSPDALWDMTIYVWRLVPEFFAAYDPDRTIEEDSSKWTQQYFDEQRNFLRHNFCLERLCHLVMVHEYLHGAEIRTEKTPAPCTSIEPEHRTPSASSRKFPGSFLFFVLAMLAVALAVLGLKNGELAEQLQHSKEETRIAIENAQSAKSQAEALANELDRFRNEVKRSNARVQELESQVNQLKERLRQRQVIPDTKREDEVQLGAEP
jgi:hypothetical protein